MDTITLTVDEDDYTVAVDLDGVIYKLVPVLRNRIHRVLGRPLHTLPTPRAYDLEAEWDLPHGTILEQLMEGVQHGDVFWQGNPHRAGLAGLRTLKAAGYRIVLLSARDLPGLEDLCFDATTHWLTQPHVDAVYDDLVLTSAKNTVHYHYLVDDYEKNVRGAHATGRGAILVNRSWNINVSLEQAGWRDIPALIDQHRKERALAA